MAAEDDDRTAQLLPTAAELDSDFRVIGFLLPFIACFVLGTLLLLLAFFEFFSRGGGPSS